MSRCITKVLVPAVMSAVMMACSQAESESPAVVIVNGRAITQSEVDYRWAELPETMRLRYQSQGGKRRFLDDLITREILLQEARRLGLDYSPTVVERMERVREQVLMDELMKELVQGRPDVAEDELRAYTQTHAASTLELEQVRLAQIVVPSEQQARDIKRQLEQGYDFGRLAQKHSVDEASRAKSGDLGVYHKGLVAPQVEPALLTLKPGAVSDPIASPAGYHLIKVISRLPPDSAEAHTARQRLRQEMLAEKRRKQFEDALAKLRASATIRLADVTGLAIESAGAPTGGR